MDTCSDCAMRHTDSNSEDSCPMLGQKEIRAKISVCTHSQPAMNKVMKPQQKVECCVKTR